MKKNFYLLLIVMLFCGCKTEVSSNDEGIEQEFDLTMNHDEFRPDTVSSVSGDTSSCFTTLAEYRNKMGRGIMSLSIRPGDSIIFRSSPEEATATGLVIGLDDSYKLFSAGKSEDHFSPFKFATNFENYGFIWMSSDTAKECEEIHLSNSDHSYWLCSEEKSKCQFIPWEDYLHLQRVSIEKDNPIYLEPNNNSEQVGYPNGVYYVFEVQEMWIRIAPIDREDPSQELETMKTVGWVKWFCNGDKRINILDDTDMEDYYNTQ